MQELKEQIRESELLSDASKMIVAAFIENSEEAEKEQLRHAFLCGDDASFHYQIPDFTSFDEYWFFLKQQHGV